ncbi:MAG: PEP-CTERM sorting domain-containing protein [Phycisphaerae bacterium]|jgi:hypothetical protein
MRRSLLILAILGGLAGAAVADMVYPAVDEVSYTTDLNGNIVEDGGPRVAVRVYDRWTAPGTTLQGLYASGTNEIGDDLFMTGGGLLDTMGLSVANANGPAGSTLTGGAGTIRFYNQDGGRTFIGGFNFTLPALSLGVGSSARLNFAAGALIGLNIVLPQNVWVTTQWTNITGTGGLTIANAGIQVRNPALIGSSNDVMWNRTGNSDFFFGGNPLANNAYFIDVPEPATIGLLIVCGLAALRRR